MQLRQNSNSGPQAKLKFRKLSPENNCITPSKMKKKKISLKI